MKGKKGKKSIVEIKVDRLAKAMERGFAAVAEDMDSLRGDTGELKTGFGELKTGFGELKAGLKKVEDRLTAVESKLGGIHNRIDGETFARKDLEVRVRKILPTLPRSTVRA